MSWKTKAIDLLIDHYHFQKSGEQLVAGYCPACNKKEAYAYLDSLVICCPRENKCGKRTLIKDIFPDLFTPRHFSEPTADNPRATADDFLKSRGLSAYIGEKFYRQSAKTRKTEEGDKTFFPTIQFSLSNGATHERLIGFSGKNKSHNKGSYQGHLWLNPTASKAIQNQEKIKKFYIVEGILDALSLDTLGVSAGAILSSSHIPKKWIEENKNLINQWVVALDSDVAGQKGSQKLMDHIRDAGLDCAVCLPYSGCDWNDLLCMKRLTSESLELMRINGAIQFAETLEEKAWHLFQKRRLKNPKINFFKELMEFDFETYKLEISISQYEKWQQKQGFKHSEMMPLREIQQSHFEAILKIKNILNGIIKPIHLKKNERTQEVELVCEIHDADRGSYVRPLSLDRLSSKYKFNKTVLSWGEFLFFSGSDEDLALFAHKWKRMNLKPTKEIDRVGYDLETNSFILGGVAYHQGQKYEKDKYGSFEFSKKKIVIEEEIERSLGFIASDKEADWFDDFEKVHGVEGISVLSHWINSLHASQIKSRHNSLPFLELTGVPGTGKTSCIQFLWKLLGKTGGYQGENPNTSTFIAISRKLTQLSNLPFCIVEAKNESDEAVYHRYNSLTWSDFLNCYEKGGKIRSKAPKNQKNNVEDYEFNSGLFIIQNAQVDSTQGFIERLLPVEFLKKSITEEERQAYNRLHNLQTEQVSGFITRFLLTSENLLQHFFASYERCRQDLLLENPSIDERLIKNFAQWQAGVCVLESLFDRDLSHVLQYIAGQMNVMKERLGMDSSVCGRFYEQLEFINSKNQGNHEDEERIEEILNHSNQRDEIWINLPHYEAMAREAKLNPIDSKILRKELKNSRKYEFIENSNARSRIFNRVIKVWKFKRFPSDQKKKE